MTIQRGLVVTLAIVGCSAPASVVQSPKPVEPVVATPAYRALPLELPPAPVAASLRTSCSTGTAAAAGKSKVYDFAAIELAPLSYGPRIEFAPNEGYVRTARSIRAAISRQDARFMECLRAALGKGLRYSTLNHGAGTVVSVDVRMTIDPFGFPSDVQVEGDARLTGCVRDSLDAIQVSRRTPRETRISGTYRFLNVAAVKPSAKAPPPPVANARPSGCLRTLDPLPVDTFAIDDLGGVSPDSLKRHGVDPGCSMRDVNKLQIRAALDANFGAYRACRIEASKRQPGLSGTTTARFDLASTIGAPEQLVVSGDGDPEFHRCLHAAIAMISVESSSRVSVTIPFALVPPPPLATDPATALATLDVDTAARLHADLARMATSDDAACRARAGVVTAYATVPWLVDPRVLAAIDALATFVADHDRAALAGCLTDVLPVLERIGRWPLRERVGDRVWRGAGLMEAVNRSTRLVAAFPELARSLEPFIADGLLALDEFDKALDTYVHVIELGGLDHAQLIRALNDHHRAANASKSGIDPHFCEVNYVD